MQVDSVNGQSIKNMRQLTKIVDGCMSEWLRIVLENNVTVSLESFFSRSFQGDFAGIYSGAHSSLLQLSVERGEPSVATQCCDAAMLLCPNPGS